MYQRGFVVGRFTATLFAATSWKMLYIVNGVSNTIRFFDSYALNADAQTLHLNKLTAETHAQLNSASRVGGNLAVSIYRSHAGQDGDVKSGSGCPAPKCS